MVIEVEQWSVFKLIKQRELIREQPPYQRGKVWPKAKKQLLIDSVLRGFDMPKIYLRELEDDFFKYEVADGQQRVGSLFDFYDNLFTLASSSKYESDIAYIGGIKTGGMKFKKLSVKHNELAQIYLNKNITVAIVKGADDEQIRTLFGRLQLGTQLNTAEKRNAIISTLGRAIDNFAQNHLFFPDSGINESRFTRQDYLAHALTLCSDNNANDLKALLIDKLYKQYSHSTNTILISDTHQILKWMGEINKLSCYNLSNKWTFVDTFWFLYKNLKKRVKTFDSKRFAELFNPFEEKRRAFYSNPDFIVVNGDATAEEKELFRYLTAFKTDGALVASIAVRSQVFDNHFTNCFTFENKNGH